MKNLNYLYVIVLISGLFITTSNSLALSKKYFITQKNQAKIKTNEPTKTKKKGNSKKSAVELLNFEAIKHENKVEVFWTIKSESTNKRFTLERSKNGFDFETVSVIDAANTTMDIIQYIETDFKPLKGVSYYRLKLTDTNNTNSYSQVVMVNYIYEKSIVSIYPNTNSGDLKQNMKRLENKEVLVVLRDFEGREYYSKVFVVLENSEIVGIDTERKLGSGTYIVTATSNNILYSQKLVVR